MSEKKVISIRFCTENKADMELYERLEQEAGTSASLASVVKARIKSSYEEQALIHWNAELKNKIAEVVREEVQKSGLKVLGKLLANVDDGGMQPIISSTLPEISEELPSGALEFLE